MIRSIIMAFSTMLAMQSCTKDDDHWAAAPATGPSIPIPVVVNDTMPPRSFLALGDSYTIGQSVPATDRFPVQAIKSLGLLGIKFDNPEIIAQTGWTTTNLLSALAFAAPLKPKYDIVTLLIGVNNQYQHGSQQQYADQFASLLNMAVQYAGDNKKRVIVLSIPDYSVTPFASGSDRALIAKEIDSFNVINRTISMEAGVLYLDITGVSRFAADNPSLVASDGLHPSAIEYKVWADALVPVIQKTLQ